MKLALSSSFRLVRTFALPAVVASKAVGGCPSALRCGSVPGQGLQALPARARRARVHSGLLLVHARPALLGARGAPQNSLRSLRSLRSNSCGESVHEARCARGEPCAGPRPALPPRGADSLQEAPRGRPAPRRSTPGLRRCAAARASLVGSRERGARRRSECRRRPARRPRAAGAAASESAAKRHRPPAPLPAQQPAKQSHGSLSRPWPAPA